MYKLLLLIPFFLILHGCTQTGNSLKPRFQSNKQVAPYSLEELDIRYHQEN